MHEHAAYLITSTTYGTWLPGDDRGWCRRNPQPPAPCQPTALAAGESPNADNPGLAPTARMAAGKLPNAGDRTNNVILPQPRLERWCRERMTGDTVLLRPHDRATVEDACREHCAVRGWEFLAVNARSNHVHVVVVADALGKTVRDQLKANCTRRLRRQAVPLNVAKTWTVGGNIRILRHDTAINAAITYVVEGQTQRAKRTNGVSPGAMRADGASRG
ncbi:MAG: hypothetical protein ACR2NU_12305 [Aeoliella sp.]